MRLPIYFFTLVFLTCCSEQDRKYKISDKALERAVFEYRLEQRGIPYKIDNQGFYITPASKYDEMISMGETVLKITSLQTSTTIDKMCSSKELIEWLKSKNIIFVLDETGNRSLLTLMKQDFDSNDVMNHYAQLHSDCAKSGLEPYYNDIWKRHP